VVVANATPANRGAGHQRFGRSRIDVDFTTGTEGLNSYAYQWKRASANIGGAVASSYLLVSADAGRWLSPAS
jgi:hypothetical protein